MFKSKVKSAEVLTGWVCSEVLPSIRTTGSYNSKYPYRSDSITKDEAQEFANGREDGYPYDVVKHIQARYPDAVLQAGLGEHLTKLHARIDATIKGYIAGQHDVIIVRGLPNGFQDVLAIECKHPNGRGKLKRKQQEYHTNLNKQCSVVETIVGNDYEEISLPHTTTIKRYLLKAKFHPYRTSLKHTTLQKTKTQNIGATRWVTIRHCSKN